MIKAESDQEIYLINEIASKLNTNAQVAIRVNPEVDARNTSIYFNSIGRK